MTKTTKTKALHSTWLTIILTYCLLLASAPTSADESEYGDFSLSFRYRFETVSQDGFTEDADASTLRTRLNYQSAELDGFSFFAEVDNVSAIGSDDYNSTRNGQTQFPVVADPEGTSLNQAWVGFTAKENRFKLGRQRINLDNQRFIGSVAWRQNEQTFDALTWQNSTLDFATINYGYLNKVDRIFGPDDGAPTDTFDSNSHFMNVAFKPQYWGTVTAYAYLLDFDNAAALSSRTLGVRAVGDFRTDGQGFKYEAEWATQDDYGDNPVDYTANYGYLNLGMDFEFLSLALGYEQLEGDANRTGSSFRTPLATLHKFQGWTDRFLNTPDSGIEDLYATVGTNINGIRFLLTYHDFNSETGGLNYGDEWGLLVTKSFGQYGNFLLKYAQFSADGFATDSDRLWLQYFINF